MIMLGVQWEEFSIYLFVKRGLDRDNITSYRSIFASITNFFIGRPYNEANFLSYMEYLEIERKLANSSINNHLKLLKHMNKYLGITPDFAAEHPYKKKIEPYIEILTNEELTRLIACSYEIEYRVGVMTEILAKTAIRNSELINLKWEDFKTDRLILQKTKAGVIQTVYCPKDLSDKLLKMKRYKHGYIVGTNYGRLNRERVNFYLKKAATMAGITKYVHAHLLRHTAGTQAAENVENPFKVKEFMRHASLDSTLRYVHMTMNNVREVSEALPVNQESVTFEMVKDMVKKYISKKTTYPVCNMSYEEQNDEIVFRIRKSEMT